LQSTAQECPRVQPTDFPAKDLPSPTDRKLFDLTQQHSYKYYYGIGLPVDYVKARQLAFLEMEAQGDNEDPLEGSSVLLMLYANGFGVTRDLDLAARLACANVGGAPAEVEGRLQHIRDMQTKSVKDTFDICDDITSGLMMGYCQSIRSQIANVRRKATLDSLLQTWSDQDRIAYTPLRKAASSFFTERSTNELDLSGTARAAFSIQESDALEDDFQSLLLQSASCALTAYSASDLMKADAQLNALYGVLMKDTLSHWGTITREGIRSTQRAWVHYRDAWVAFGAIRCPATTSNAWKTLLTNARIEQLKELIEIFKYK
jgi:uncharacterized protein YecT (DUF1311 family)